MQQIEEAAEKAEDHAHGQITSQHLLSLTAEWPKQPSSG